MENVGPRWRPSRPYELRLERIREIRRNHPELYELRLSEKKEEIEKRKKLLRLMESPDYEKIRQASILAMLEKTGCPDIIGSWPCSVADTSAEATCYTKEEDDMYKKYAVEHPLERVFKVCNPKTGLPDEVYTACVIERYREYHSAKRNEPVLKRHRTEEKGESTETVVPASSYVLCWYCRPSARNYCG